MDKLPAMRALKGIVKDIQDIVLQGKMPAGYYVTYGGQFKTSKKPMPGLQLRYP